MDRVSGWAAVKIRAFPGWTAGRPCKRPHRVALCRPTAADLDGAYTSNNLIVNYLPSALNEAEFKVSAALHAAVFAGSSVEGVLKCALA